ncbi:ABC transporter substrate-binding protein [Polynucleobacter sp. SHI8]|uniref:TRAP transporter substrate-binding protein n=1 Tax=unclassified Polynucleobacter TaxID=2640945 RepID=UPI002492C589|nr:MULTISPECIES: TRAP transporter substrate-binding protein [unclassified Polynucleobacter]BDW10362.1 ABC transporter substrate-binding protein [Polynucleobacter sp. SHI2]BDW12808.1 ABC transporter substrate-binding protein [Polynucleobacter sp. SHI8]
MSTSSKARWSGFQYHYQPEKSHVHPFLVDLWKTVELQTDGLVQIEVCANNGGLKHSHLEIVQDLIEGKIQFYALMGSILGPIAPVMNIQSLPFIFGTNDDVYDAMDGEIGEYLKQELIPHGIYLFPHGLMENGFRHIVCSDKPIYKASDLAGVSIRIPEGKVFEDTFKSLGANPVPLFVLELYDALKTGKVTAQENPLAILDSLKLYEVTTYVSKTAHMWSGFNLIGNLPFWQSMPRDIQEIIQSNMTHYVAKQRQYTIALNAQLEQDLISKGMIFNQADTQTFRACLKGDFYSGWKQQLGPQLWSLLEQRFGKLVSD